MMANAINSPECPWQCKRNPPQPCKRHWGCLGTSSDPKGVREILGPGPLPDTTGNCFPWGTVTGAYQAKATAGATAMTTKSKPIIY